MAQLALLGGEPLLDPPLTAAVQFSPQARTRVDEAIATGTLNRFYGGVHVREFEADFAACFGRSHAVAVNSGTSALHLGYAAARLEPGTKVLVPANAYVSAVSALIQCSLIPVLVDIDPVQWTMDNSDLQSKLCDRTSAVVAVHMYGQPCDMDVVVKAAKEHGALLIEDCGQAHGARYGDRLVGTFGHAAMYSVCCRKSVSVGEGGMVVSGDSAYIDIVRALAHKGKGPGFFDYRELGFSYGLTEIQAILGSDQVAAFPAELAKRQRHAAIYAEAAAGTGLGTAHVRPGDVHGYFKFPVSLPSELAHLRQRAVDALLAEGAMADPAHPCLSTIEWIQSATEKLCHQFGVTEVPDNTVRSTPVAAELLSRSLCLEVGHSLSDEAVTAAAAAVRKVIAHADELDG